MHIEKALLLIWFILNLSIGALTVHEYGISIDEPNNYRYAADTLDAYPSLFGILYEPKYDSSYDGHGPAFVAITAVLIKVIQSVFPNVFTPDLWHFSYFIAFQLTGLCLYWLTKRWFNKWTAWGILILFSTQPLLLGHAFTNPKDIPFMFLFTLSIVLGFRLVDNMEAKESFVSLERSAKVLTNKFQNSDPQCRKKFLTYFASALATALALVIFSDLINPLIELIVTFFHTANPGSWAGQIFGFVASHASEVSVDDYVTKAVKLLSRVEIAMLLAGLLFFLAYFSLLVNDTTLPAFLHNTWKQQHKLKDFAMGLAKSLRNSLNPGTLKNWSAEFFQAFRNPHIFLAGIALGLATGVRAIAPWAGMIVFLYLLVKIRSKAWSTIAACFLVAGAVTYLAWPHLWGAPILRYLEGLGVISNFPDYPQRVLFNGQLYGDTDLPRSYLPILLNIQFTEPYLLSVYIGLGILIWRLLRDRLRTDLLIYIGMGFAFPLFELILLNPPLYNNFRQILFLVPAMFMIAAFALEPVFSKITNTWARVLLIIVIVLPGIYSSAKLYPYEYIYYNSLVGGTAGAQDRYELDYFRISLREVALELNEIAPKGATVVVTRSAGLFVKYTRPDLVVDKIINSILNLGDGYDYAVQLVHGQNWDIYPDFKNVIIIERAGAVLATAKAMKNSDVK